MSQIMSMNDAPAPRLPEWGRRLSFDSFAVELVPQSPRVLNLQLDRTFASINFSATSGTSSLAGDRLRPYDRRPFEFVVVPPGFPIQGENPQAPEVLAFLIDFDQFRPILAAAYAMDPADLRPQVILGTPAPFTTELAKKIRIQLSLPEPACPYIESLATALLAEMFRPVTAPPQERAKRRLDGKTIGMLLKYIDANLEQALPVPELADLVGISAPHLSRSFKQNVGESLHTYILHRRTDAARRFLSEDGLSLAEIALKSGFSSQSHMTSVFRKLLGQTPGEVRRTQAGAMHPSLLTSAQI